MHTDREPSLKKPAAAALPLLFLALAGCSAQPHVADPGWTNIQAQVAKQSDGREETEAAATLRELLAVSIENAAVAQARPGGYVKNLRVRIGFPEPLLPVAEALIAAGQQVYVDDFVIDMNVGAEITAGKSAPLLRQALAAMTIQDALVTLHGDDTAAMRDFRRQSEAQLLAGFEPLVSDSLRRCGGFDSYRAMLDNYYRLPGAVKILFNYELYVRERAVDGLYVAIGDEERAIRQDPARRTTAQLRKAFAQQSAP